MKQMLRLLHKLSKLNSPPPRTTPKFETQSKFPIIKQHKYFYLHQQYNSFILRQNGAGHDDVVKFMSIYTLYSDRVSTSYSSLRRLYRASEQLVLDVAMGNF